MAFKIPNHRSDLYPLNREKSFTDTIARLSEYQVYGSDKGSICLGDSLELLKLIPDHSVDLILTDPPYHSTKKSNIYGDRDFPEDKIFLDWIDSYFAEWKRILRANGSIYVFCSSDMAPFIYVNASRSMNMHGTITWTKPNEPGFDGWKQKMKKTSLRRWYPHSEKIVFCSPAADGNLKKSHLGILLKQLRKRSGLSSNKLTELVGAYGKVNNGGAVSNWETGRNIPSREQYSKICTAITSNTDMKFMPNYEDVVRAFNVDPKEPFTDVWDFVNVRPYSGKHPAEKPADLLEHIIRTSSYEHDVVLDCFSGSGSTIRAANKLNRRGIGIEIDPSWARQSADTISAIGGGNLNGEWKDHPKDTTGEAGIEKLPLFHN